MKNIEIFQNNEYKFFQDINIEITREQRNPHSIEYEIRRENNNDFAIIQTFPDEIIQKNFLKDTINMFLIKKINEFNKVKFNRLLRLTAFKTNTLMEFKIKNQKIILFRGKIFNKKYINDKKINVSLYNGWNYVVKPFEGEK